MAYGQVFRKISLQEIGMNASQTITATIADIAGQPNRYTIQFRNGSLAYNIPGISGLKKNDQVAVLSFPGGSRYQVLGTTYTFSRSVQEFFV